MTSSAQPVSGGPFGAGNVGAGERGRYTSVAATSAAGDAATAIAPITNNDTAATAAATGTAPTTGAAETVSGTITDQVTGHLLRLMSNGTRDMTMRLHPPELGDLTVRVAVSGREVSAWFASPQPQVQSAISAALGQLQTNLGNAGYNLTGAWVGADASGAQQQGPRLPEPLPIPASPASPSAVLPAVAAAARPAVSGLNIYV